MRPRRALGSSLVAAALVALGACAPGALAAGTFRVNPELKDGPISSSKCESPCSLRQAINDANEFTREKKEDATVEVPPGTYLLTEGPLLVEPAKETTESIIGVAERASEVVIKPSPSAEGEVMRVGTATGNGAGNTTLVLLEIAEGDYKGPGGGIYVYPESSLGLVLAAVVDNSSETSGGGIDTNGAVSAVDSLIAGNVVHGFGGGIDNSAEDGAEVVIVNTTVADNTASGAGGGIYNGAPGLKVVSATVAGNKAGAEGGAIAGEDSFEAIDSIFAKNQPGNCSAIAGATGELGHNIFDDSSCKGTAPGDKEANPQLVEEAGLPLLADNGGATETIALQSTSPAIGAGSEFCPPTDQRDVARPAGACDVGAFQLGEEPSGPPPKTPATTTTSIPTVTSPGPTAPPPPTLGRTGNAATVSGTVLVRLPGTTTFVALSSLRQIPFGTVINATNGRVRVITAGPHGGTQEGEFFEGEFVLTQGHDGLVVATLTGGSFAGCPTARERGHLARLASSGRHVVRKLWADAHGSFSTKGNYAAGAVAGTEWLTEDLCDGTLIRVTRDKVAVTNLVTHRHVLVKVGHSYLAKAP
jgi:hypothetical protein